MISAPAVRWPSELSELGPESDPTILLAGDAMLAGIPFRVMALRVPKAGREPDFLNNVPQEDYPDSLANMVEVLEDLVESIELPSIKIGNKNYLLWMVPNPP